MLTQSWGKLGMTMGDQRFLAIVEPCSSPRSISERRS